MNPPPLGGAPSSALTDGVGPRGATMPFLRDLGVDGRVLAYGVGLILLTTSFCGSPAGSTCRSMPLPCEVHYRSLTVWLGAPPSALLSFPRRR